jgi:transcriptional regulator with XRE-family HTH domain
MISNERQYNKSVKSLEEFVTRLDEARERYGDNPILLELQTGQLERHIEELAAEIEEYETARAGELAPVLPSYNPRSGRLEIGRALTRMRLSKGLTQEQVAELIGTHQPSITRWESPTYEAYRLNDLKKLANALGRELDVFFIERHGEEAPKGQARQKTFEQSLNEMIEASPELSAWKEALPPEARAELTDKLKDVIQRLTEEAVAMTMHLNKEVG